MHLTTSILQTDKAGFLKEQAQMVFKTDPASHAITIDPKKIPAQQASHQFWADAMKNLVKMVHSCRQSHLSNLRNNLMFRAWERDSAALSHISNVMLFHGLTDFQFLDFGGRALVFRCRHHPSMRPLVARFEAPHAHRHEHIHHATILPSLLSWSGPEHFDIKIELREEILPLSKLPARKYYERDSRLGDVFHKLAVELAMGSNMTYPISLFDKDAEPQNLGVQPDGRIVSFDPQIVTGEAALAAHRHFVIPSVFKDASALQLGRLYGAKVPVTPLKIG